MKNDRTAIAVAKRSTRKQAPKPAPEVAKVEPAPRHVAILGMGPSVTTYLEITKRLGGRHKFADATWSINALGNVFDSDLVFHMDDVRVQEVRAAVAPDSNIAAMLAWIKKHTGPVITSRAHSGYSGLVEFPLEAVVRQFNRAYFNSTAAYSIAYALHIGVKKISIFGFDFTYPNAHHAEKGRACVEFWLGIAAGMGVEIAIPQTSSLMDACHTQAERLYGYDTLDVHMTRSSDEPVRITFTPRTEIPTAEEIEARYDHNKHPSPLVG